MRIAIFSDTFLPQINGIVTATIMMAKELARQGHEVHILAPEFKNYTKDGNLPFAVKRFASIPAFFYEEFKWVVGPNPAILSYVIKNKFHIIHFQTPVGIGFQAIIIAKLLSKPLVGTFHTFIADPDYLRHINLDNKLMENIGWFYTNLYYNRCDVVTVPSHQTGVELKARGCRAPIRYLTNGIDVSQFDNTKADEVREKAGLKEGDTVFMYVGRLAHEKNIEGLVEAFSYTAKQAPGFKLLIVGGGPQADEYRELAETVDTERSCIFLGRMEHDELVTSGVFGVASFFITLSKTENQPVTILEAQANGIIPICLPEKGLKTMIEHRKNGFFLRSEEPAVIAEDLIALTKDRDLIAKMKTYIKDFVQKQSMAQVARDWERLYAGLILKKTSRSILEFLFVKLIRIFRPNSSVEKRMKFHKEEHLLNDQKEFGTAPTEEQPGPSPRMEEDENQKEDVD